MPASCQDLVGHHPLGIDPVLALIFVKSVANTLLFLDAQPQLDRCLTLPRKLPFGLKIFVGAQTPLLSCGEPVTRASTFFLFSTIHPTSILSFYNYNYNNYELYDK